MRIELFGVRGSRPAPGSPFVRYGGHTSCVAVAHDGGGPVLVIDAGTGLSAFSDSLAGAPFRGALLLSHLHWDHIYGLPFFPAGDRPDASVQVYLPAQGDPEDVLAQTMRPPFFPITPDGLRGDWSFHALEPGRQKIEGFEVLARDIPHKGGRTYGFRVSDGTSSLAYLSDHAPIEEGEGPDGHGAYHEAAMELCTGVDLLIHDAQYTAHEFQSRRAFGHCTIDYAAGLAAATGARSLLLFHHDPRRTDEQLDEIAASFPGATVAREGMRIALAVPPADGSAAAESRPAP